MRQVRYGMVNLFKWTVLNGTCFSLFPLFFVLFSFCSAGCFIGLLLAFPYDFDHKLMPFLAVLLMTC